MAVCATAERYDDPTVTTTQPLVPIIEQGGPSWLGVMRGQG
jgi:hypothetical protein